VKFTGALDVDHQFTLQVSLETVQNSGLLILAIDLVLNSEIDLWQVTRWKATISLDCEDAEVRLHNPRQ
jgi:hypothetical protein